jgi:hypothetical protein
MRGFPGFSRLGIYGGDVLRALADLESAARLFLYVAKTGKEIIHKIPGTRTLFFV